MFYGNIAGCRVKRLSADGCGGGAMKGGGVLSAIALITGDMNRYNGILNGKPSVTHAFMLTGLPL